MASRGPVLVLTVVACAAERDEGVRVTFPISGVGAEADALRAQVARFEQEHPHIDVDLVATPDSADERHQRYVQWLAAGADDPDVLQLDVVWIAELAGAGWLLPLDGFEPDTRDLFPSVLAADRLDGQLYALPWFVDVGMLYRRTDRVPEPDRLDDLRALSADRAVAYGLVLQGARYEGLVTVFLEVLGAHGGALIVDGQVAVDRPEAVAALTWLRDRVNDGTIPVEALTWQEEQARLAFQRGDALFMRNWPYAAPLLAEAGVPFAVGPMPATPQGEPTAALGGAHLAINAGTDAPEAAWTLVSWLLHPDRVRERTRLTGQLPALRSLYDEPQLADALPIDAPTARAIVAAAEARPVTPRYTQLSQALQVRLHRVLTGQAEPEPALRAAAAEMRAVLAGPRRATPAEIVAGQALLAALAAGALAAIVSLARRLRRTPPEGRLGLALVAPTIGVVALVAVFPLLWTVWESLHLHDLRDPAAGRPFVGIAHYVDIAADGRFWDALGHTLFFAATTVSLELVLGVTLALGLDRVRRARGLARVVVLLPWALPTVVAALVWRFLFDGPWLGDPQLAWVPVILADVWKSTPFVALLALAGLQAIDDDLYEAARVDGAGAWSRFLHVTLPLLRPTLVVVLLFRALDALRVFGLVYVLTGGGPGTATEPVALYTFAAILEHLRFGYGSALSVLVFALTFGLALLYLRAVGGRR